MDAACIYPITMTESCLQKVYALLAEENHPGLALRIYITGGGCSGFQYGFMFDDQDQMDDWVIHIPISMITWGTRNQGDYLNTSKAYCPPRHHPIAAEHRWSCTPSKHQNLLPMPVVTIHATCLTVKIDAISMHYLPGACVDYKSDIHGERFVVANPNASAQCSCGASFAA